MKPENGYLKSITEAIWSDRTRFLFWWVAQISSLYFYTSAFVTLNRTDLMPLAGAGVTVFSWYSILD